MLFDKRLPNLEDKILGDAAKIKVKTKRRRQREEKEEIVESSTKRRTKK